MAYHNKKVATCACGTGDQHSLRQSGICDGLRTGVLSQAQATEQLDRLSQTKEKRQQAQRSTPDVAVAADIQPASEV